MDEFNKLIECGRKRLNRRKKWKCRGEHGYFRERNENYLCNRFEWSKITKSTLNLIWYCCSLTAPQQSLSVSLSLRLVTTDLTKRSFQATSTNLHTIHDNWLYYWFILYTIMSMITWYLECPGTAHTKNKFFIWKLSDFDGKMQTTFAWQVWLCNMVSLNVRNV